MKKWTRTGRTDNDFRKQKIHNKDFLFSEQAFYDPNRRKEFMSVNILLVSAEPLPGQLDGDLGKIIIKKTNYIVPNKKVCRVWKIEWLNRPFNSNEEGLLTYWCGYQNNQGVPSFIGFEADFFLTVTMDSCLFAIGSKVEGKGIAVTHFNNQGALSQNYIGPKRQYEEEEIEREEKRFPLRPDETEEGHRGAVYQRIYQRRMALNDPQYKDGSQLIDPNDYLAKPPEDWIKRTNKKLHKYSRDLSYEDGGQMVTTFGIRDSYNWDFFTNRYTLMSNSNPRVYVFNGTYKQLSGAILQMNPAGAEEEDIWVTDK